MNTQLSFGKAVGSRRQSAKPSKKERFPAQEYTNDTNLHGEHWLTTSELPAPQTLKFVPSQYNALNMLMQYIKLILPLIEKTF